MNEQTKEARLLGTRQTLCATARRNVETAQQALEAAHTNLGRCDLQDVHANLHRAIQQLEDAKRVVQTALTR